jgi:hypothetical protein
LFALTLQKDITPHLKKNNLNSLSPVMIYAKSGGNWQSGFGEKVENVKILRTDGQWAVSTAHS